MNDEAQRIAEAYTLAGPLTVKHGEMVTLARAYLARSASEDMWRERTQYLLRTDPDEWPQDVIKWAADEEHGYAEHLREAREVEAHQEAKHGDA